MSGRMEPDQEPEHSAFAAVLRQLRKRAQLTQEQLSERSGLSPTTISELERGSRRAPQGASAGLLADALGLDGEERAEFLAAADAARVRPGPRPPEPVRPPEAAWPMRGRDGDLETLRSRLRGGDRWITLVGEGGIGKTRLAVEAARRAASDGWLVVWVACDALREPAEVLPALATAAGLPGRSGAPALERLERGLRSRQVLAVLDNMEHLLDAAGPLLEAQRALPGLVILATSRERFRVRGETALALDPLALPEDESPEAAVASPAVSIFFDRGGAVPGLLPSDADLAAAARIVRMLDGMPLAIELAAAQLGMLSAQAIAELLERSGLSALGSWRDGPERFRSMQQAIRWSTDLLSGDARLLLRLLSVFRGGFTVEAAARAAAGTGHPQAARALPGLVAASLVREVRTGGGAPRFTMLEPVRLAALADLAAAGEERAARDAHAAQSAAAAVIASARQIGAGGQEREALEYFAAERPNLLAALDHLLATGQASAALPLANALGFWWELTGAVREGYGWLMRAVAADDGTAPARDRWLVRCLASLLALEGGDYAEERRLAEEAGEIAREAGDAEGEAFSETLLAAWQQTAAQDLPGALSRLDRAIELGEAALERNRGAWLPLAFAANLRGTYRYFGEGETERSLADLRRSIELFRTYASPTLVGMPLVNMSAVLQGAGKQREAMDALSEAIAIGARHDQPLVRANAAMRMASLLSEQGDHEAAAASARLLGALDAMMERQGFREDAMMGGENAETRRRLALELGPDLDREVAAGRRLAEAAGGDPDLIALVSGEAVA